MSSQRFTVAQVLDSADRRGIQLSVDDRKLKIQAPKGVLNAKIRQVLSDYKSELIEALTPLSTVAHVLVSADDLGIQLSLKDGELKAQAPTGWIPPNIRQALIDHEAELIEALTLYCYACLEPALADDYDGYMYCALHHPMRQNGAA